jgi:beta-galactosidase
MKKYLLFIFLCLLLLNQACKHHPEIYVKDVNKPLISLNGSWEICLAPYDNIIKRISDSIVWNEIKVPGECMMQGYAIKHDQPFTYRKEILIPSDYKGSLIKIRFEGVYSYARIWIDGKYICDHYGGFTSWECDITSVANPGKTATLMVEVIDKADEISYASGYAKHQIGGILGNVILLALPLNYPDNLSVSANLDEQYRNAILIIKGTTRLPGNNNQVAIELLDADNKRVELPSDFCPVTGNEFIIRNLIMNPLKWDAEHPNLYSLKVSFIGNGKVTWYKYYQIGFREIEIQGNQFLINGKQVKLRGVCRHEIEPLLGRVSTPEYEMKDVLLAKEANINFIRTSHYPPSENFLKLCDKYGIYVEDETAVCFVGSHRTAEYYPGSTESSPDYKNRYLSQLKEMVYNHRNHPSVIIWSIGNENTFGTNFRKSYDWVKDNDPSRPVIFSYPGLVPDSIKSYDLISMHYPGTDGTMEQYGITTKSFGNDKMPVIFDEWAHVACYNSFTVKEDPNIRDFWGISLDSMWQRLYDADGGLGGAIWGMIDETFMLPADLPGYNEWWGKIDKNVIPGEFTGHTIGYGEWGIVDTWRRKKPEFWNVKKAYSPVRLLNTENVEFSPEKAIEIQVYNRFDFTNLNELKFKLKLEGKSHILVSPDIPAHSRGIIFADIDNWTVGKLLYIDITDKNDKLIDSYALSRKTHNPLSDAIIPDGDLEITDDAKTFIISCEDNLKLRIDKSTGLFDSIETTSGKKLFSGPYINLRTLGKADIYSSHKITDYCTDWELDSLSVKKRGNSVTISVKGRYISGISAEFLICVFPCGLMSLDYSISEMPQENIREIGIRYILDNAFDSLEWKRKPYWSTYPAGHLSAPIGKVPLYTSNNKIYRKSPEKEWNFDKKSFFYNGIEDEISDAMINAARATKENIFEYKLSRTGKGDLFVYGNGDIACRIEKTGNKIILSINNEADYPDLSWGNYSRNIILNNEYSGKVQMSIH